MTQDGFRRLALSLPEATEVGHMGHPDFRVRGKIFATLGYPDGGFGMLKLTPEQQEALISAEPLVFSPIKGAWGRGGATNVRLAAGEDGPCPLGTRPGLAQRRAARAGRGHGNGGSTGGGAHGSSEAPGNREVREDEACGVGLRQR